MGLEIICTNCGAETLIRKEPVYDGFKKVGEKSFCTSCGHEFEEDSIPFKEASAAPSIFTEDDKPMALDIFTEDEKTKNCRRCRHYVVNPFTQRCGLHDKTIEATDVCFDFEAPPEEEGEEGEEE